MNVEKNELQMEVCKSAYETDCFIAGEALMNHIIQKHGDTVTYHL